MLRTLVNVDPRNEFRAMEDVLEKLFGHPSRPVPGTSTLPVDITEKDGALLIKAAVPGIAPNDLEISIENSVLSISGETKSESQSENEKIYRREVSYGAFSRSIRLPERLNFDQVSADFNHGMLTVTIPRIPEEKPLVVRVPVRHVNSQPSHEDPAVESAQS